LGFSGHVNNDNLNKTTTMTTKTQYAINQLEAMTVGFTKVINGKSVTRWSLNCWEVGTFKVRDARDLTQTLVDLGFEV
jgi:hypothetical protein